MKELERWKMLITNTDDMKGIDCNQILSLSHCKDIISAGYKFVIRYIGRESNHLYDISEAESNTILSCGLGLMLVQHVESESSWIPSPDKGTLYGKGAVHNARLIGYQVGAMIWLDLEGVAQFNMNPDDIIRYCNNWYDEVAKAGYLPGLYVGWHCGLSSATLYSSLKFRNYWSAYNLNTDEYPAVRGVQMKQKVHSKKTPDLEGLEYQIDIIERDRLGGLPKMASGE